MQAVGQGTYRLTQPRKRVTPARGAGGTYWNIAVGRTQRTKRGFMGEQGSTGNRSRHPHHRPHPPQCFVSHSPSQGGVMCVTFSEPCVKAQKEGAALRMTIVHSNGQSSRHATKPREPLTPLRTTRSEMVGDWGTPNWAWTAGPRRDEDVGS